MKTVEQITEILTDLSDNDLRNIWNDYQSDNRMEGTIYDFDDDFFKNFFSNPAEAARAVYFGKIESWNASYVCFNGAGNLEASNSIETLISIYDLANHIELNQDNYEYLLDNEG